MSISQQQLEENCICEIEKDNLDKFKKILSSGFNINSFLRSKKEYWDTNSFSIIAIASYFGSINIVEFLLENNVNVNQLDYTTNRSPLHWSVASKQYEISKMLIKSGAFINSLDRNRISPLIYASKNGDLNIVKLLIKHGANVNQKDRLNLSALSYACMLCHTELCIELIINGCKCIWSMAWSYCSPLEFLLQKKEYKIVKYLIESGYCLSKNEKWLMDSTYSVKKIDKNALNWVKMNLKNPKTLMNICRQEIRKRLGNEYVNEKISCLNVTYNVKQYLLMRS